MGKQPDKTPRYPTYDDVAEMFEHVFDGLEGTQEMIQKLERTMATRSALEETERRLLDAIRGIEVRKENIEELQGDVRELGARVAALEKKRGSRR